MTEHVRHGPADPSLLWAVMSDVEGWPELLDTVAEVAHLGGPDGLVVGARFRVAQPRLRSAEYVVTEVEPGRRFVWQARLPGIVTTAEHEIGLRPDGECLVKLGIRWSGPLSWLPRAFYSGLAERYLELEAKAFLEAARGA